MKSTSVMDAPQNVPKAASSPTSNYPLSPQRYPSTHPLLGDTFALSTPPADRGEKYGDPADEVQFATYNDHNDIPKIGSVFGATPAKEPRYSLPHAVLLPPPSRAEATTNFDADTEKTWVPLPLRAYFWVPFIVLLAGLAIGLEVALVVSNRKQGWPSAQSSNKLNALHYVYTLPPVMFASCITAMWAWTDYEIKKIQPYVDLVHGDSPPHRSLLLDYTGVSNFIVWTRAAHNRHYIVALTSLMVIMSLSFQPLSAALLVVKDIWHQEPDIIKSTIQSVGLNQNLQFTDLTAFLTAAGFASASILYDILPPPFVQVPYTVAQFEIPGNVKNGTAFANTTVVKSESNCQTVKPKMERGQISGSWSNSASFNGCSLNWQVENGTRILFGADVPVCDNAPLPQFAPVAFWFFAFVGFASLAAGCLAKGVVSFCFPKLSLWEANVGVDVRTGNVTKVTEIRPFTASSPYSGLSSNITGPPLNGRAYNGVMFDLLNPDQFVLARSNSTRLQLPAAIYQASLKDPRGFQGLFQSDSKFADVSNKIYSIYLSLVAREVYFLSNAEPIVVQVKTFRKRVLLSDVSVHLLAVALLILAFFASIIHIFHRDDRRSLRLKHVPGTIASAMTLGAQTGVADVLSGRQGEKDIKEALRDRRFRIDPVTMKIVMEGEYGYEYAKSPLKRRSVFALLQRGPGPSTPTSAGHSLPRSPLVPNTHTA